MKTFMVLPILMAACSPAPEKAKAEYIHSRKICTYDTRISFIPGTSGGALQRWESGPCDEIIPVKEWKRKLKRKMK